MKNLPNVRRALKQADLLLADARTMYRLPLPSRSLTAGCNYAMAITLFSIVAGLAATIYPIRVIDRKGASLDKALFVRLIVEKLPWHENAAGWMDKSTAAGAMYENFRCPLVHDLGTGLRARTHKATKWVVGKRGLQTRLPMTQIERYEEWPENRPILSEQL